MFISETKIRVRYAETDKMGYSYYGNYAQYYEIGRVEALRSLGISYKSLEDMGIMLPVAQLITNYKKPALYDDELTIRTIIKELPRVKIRFFYEIYNSDHLMINHGETTLVFVKAATMKPFQCPEWFAEMLKDYNLS